MGRGAKIFLLSALIAGCIFGLVAFAIISAVADASPKGDVDGLRSGAIYREHSLIAGESFNLLVINIDYRPESYSYSKAAVDELFGDTVYTTDFKKSGAYREVTLLSAVLLRVDRERNELTFTPIPACTVTAGSDGVSTTLAREYSLFGVGALSERVRYLTGITVDEYAVVIPSAASKITESIGGLDFYVESASTASGEVDVKTGNQNLNGAEVRTLLLAEPEKSLRENVASGLLQAFSAELSGLERGKIAELLQSIDTGLDLSQLSFIGSRYHSFKKTELTLVGQYRGGSFVPDLCATLDKFSVYRKYYG